MTATTAIVTPPDSHDRIEAPPPPEAGRVPGPLSRRAGPGPATEAEAGGASHDDGLRMGEPDRRGDRVRRILWRMRDFTIYTTVEGLALRFSDDEARRCEQLKLYLGLGDRVAQFNHLLQRLRPKNPASPRQKLIATYEDELGRCIMHALIADPMAARLSLDAAYARLSTTISNRARIVHLGVNLGCVVGAVAVGIGLTLAKPGGADGLIGRGFDVEDLILAGVMGSFGALFSTVVGLKGLVVDPVALTRMHWFYALQRVLVGAMAALVLYLGLRSGLLGVFDMAPSTDGAAPYAPHWLAFVCLLAGFAERLVPNLLDNRAKGAAGAATP